ncbi:MAG: dihydropteroate synthase [Verrucomicrobiota bacterium]
MAARDRELGAAGSFAGSGWIGLRHSGGWIRALGMRLVLPGRVIEFPRRPLVMGIVNVNDDSFSGDGTLDFEAALRLARAQVAAGADVVDVGAESARTNRAAVSVDEELRRFAGFLGRWEEVWQGLEARDAGQVWPPVLSANTWRPEVVEGVLRMGNVELVNDMGALPDGRNARACAAHGAALLIMHSVGEPKVPHFQQQWPDVMGAMERFFEAKLQLAEASGLARDAVVLDPGIDFAKQREDNLTVYRELGRLQKFGCPVLVPVSRKTVIGEVLNLPDPPSRDAGTLACISAAMLRGAQMFRVHDVGAAWQAVKVLDGIS